MPDQNELKPVLQLQNLTKKFVKPLDFAGKIAQKLGSNLRDEVVHAVDNVSLTVNKGEVVSLVGESGCGKSTLGRMVAGILQQTSGDIFYEGQNVANQSSEDAKRTALKIQMIFQDPFASLNPRLRVKDILGEAPQYHKLVSSSGLDAYLDDVMLRCGLDPDFKQRYPHQFSGGQRQRIGIARALAVQPDFIVCDEAVAALDVSIQAQVLNLFMQLRAELDLTYLFISHDLGVVEHISDRIVIMYLGRVVETADTDELFSRANHPYTQALLREIPRLETRHSDFTPIEGEIPSQLDPPNGCHFHPRCPFATDHCRAEIPTLKEISPGHHSACHLNESN